MASLNNAITHLHLLQLRGRCFCALAKEIRPVYRLASRICLAVAFDDPGSRHTLTAAFE